MKDQYWQNIHDESLRESRPGREIRILVHMEDLSFLIPILFAGIAGVTVIDVVGSITSRKYNFNYGHFTGFSLLLYIFIAFLVYQRTGHKLVTLGTVFLMALYDATAGLWISRRLKANDGRFAEYAKNITPAQAVLTMLLFSFVCGWIGIFIAGEMAD